MHLQNWVPYSQQSSVTKDRVWNVTVRFIIQQASSERKYNEPGNSNCTVSIGVLLDLVDLDLDFSRVMKETKSIA